MNKVKEIKDTFEKMMDKKKRLDLQREDDRKEKIKKDRKLKRESKFEILRKMKSGAKIPNIADPTKEATISKRDKPKTNIQKDMKNQKV